MATRTQSTLLDVVPAHLQGRLTASNGGDDDVESDSSGTPTGGATLAHGGHDDDGNLVLHVPTQDCGFDSADTHAELLALAADGTPIVGTDDIRIVGR